jgi:glutathione S-transferase
MTALKLFIGNRNYSSWSLRGWLALKASGLAFDEEVIPLDMPTTREAILRVSPSGLVPAIRHGEVTVWDSLAIIEYLAETCPDAGFWPANARTRPLARAISMEMHAGFRALRAQMPMNVRGRFPGVRPDVDARADIDRITEIWRDCIHRRGDSAGDFLFGAFCAADMMYAPVVSRFVTYDVQLDATSAAYRDAVWDNGMMREWREAAEDEPWVIDRFEFG